MKITWLGQAGLLFETGGSKFLVDPYLSDSVEKINPANKRKVPVNCEFLNLQPDVIVCTHDHLDHTDPETLKHYLGRDKAVQVLASKNAWNTVRVFGGAHNYVCFDRHTEVTFKTKEGALVVFKAVKAVHSDPEAIGVLIWAEGKQYYVTGDTLYNIDIFDDIPLHIDALFLPVNGAGNNMNMEDAKRFCEYVKPAVAIPMHCGLFDDIDMNALAYESKCVPTIYEEIKCNLI